MAEDAADGKQGHLGEPRVPGAGEQRLAVAPQRQVNVHPRAVVTMDRLRHERRRLPVTAGDVLDDVLVEADLIGHPHQFLVAHVDLALPRRGHFVMLGLDVDPRMDHRLHHLVAEIHHLVAGGEGAVALLEAELAAEIRPFLPPPVPFRLRGIDVVVTLVGVLIEADVVENEELRLRADEAGVGDPGAAQIVDRLAGDVARVAGIVLAGDRILDVADHRQRGEGREGIDDRRVGLGDEEHVALVDPLPAAEARAVEAEAVAEGILLELADRDREVLPGAEKVGKPQIDRLDLLLTAHRQHFTGLHGEEVPGAGLGMREGHRPDRGSPGRGIGRPHHTQAGGGRRNRPSLRKHAVHRNRIGVYYGGTV